MCNSAPNDFQGNCICSRVFGRYQLRKMHEIMLRCCCLLLKPHFSKQKDEFRRRGASSPLLEDKWFPPGTCCGCGCSFSGWERVYRLIYGPACVCARNFITQDTRRRKTDPRKSFFFSQFGLKDVAQREEAHQSRYHQKNAPGVAECVSAVGFAKILANTSRKHDALPRC